MCVVVLVSAKESSRGVSDQLLGLCDVVYVFNQISRDPFVVIVAQYKDARASGNTSSPCWDLLAAMHRVVNYHSSWARQRQVELFVASGIRV
ncbi:F-box/kelch-repeat protein [Dorcoceras hygrometricum]|uniref:F-box/kelch-repeat protein n=1 Tax=Dorcoceras hygrometricum TaxID=472368 RepID=A0A2Z7C1I4_9LAMI|nr:F-box/kelch-repeat protein [Dorcoceras hygrometricum]